MELIRQCLQDAQYQAALNRDQYRVNQIRQALRDLATLEQEARRLAALVLGQEGGNS